MPLPWYVNVVIWVAGLFMKPRHPEIDEAEKAGTAQADAGAAVQAAKTSAAIAQAQAQAPQTKAAVLNSLDKGEF